MRLKIAVLPPIPSASVSTATAVKPGFFSNWRKANLRSLITQSLHWIDSCGASRGQPGREQGDDQKHNRYADERERIVWLDFVEQLCEQMRKTKGARHPEHETERDKPHSMTQHQLEDIATAGAQGEPNTEFA